MIAANHPQTSAMEAMIVEKNGKLVYSVAKKYTYAKLDMEEMFTEGVVGLLRAARKFEVSKGWRFSTYAVTWIRQAIGRAAEKSGEIYVPSYCHEFIPKLQQTYSVLGQGADDEQVCLYLRWPLSRLQNMHAALSARYVLELDAPIGKDSKGDERSALLDFQSATGGDPAELVLDQEEKGKVWGLLRHLPTRQAQIIERRMDGETLLDIANSIGMSRERVRQIEYAGMSALRRMGKKMERSEVL